MVARSGINSITRALFRVILRLVLADTARSERAVAPAGNGNTVWERRRSSSPWEQTMIRIEDASPERDRLIGTSVTALTDGLSARSVFVVPAERIGGGEQRLPRPMRWLAVAALWAIAVSSAFAAPVLVPADLAPGDAYRLVFVTSGTIQPASTDIADYNAFVDPFGETLIPAHDWRAIVSTAAVDARDNTETVPGTDDPGGIPVYRLDGIRVANSYAALWNSAVVPLLVAVRLTEAAVDSPFIGNWVWTGTTSTGVAGGPLGSLPGFPVDYRQYRRDQHRVDDWRQCRSIWLPAAVRNLRGADRPQRDGAAAFGTGIVRARIRPAHASSFEIGPSCAPSGLLPAEGGGGVGS